MIMWTILLVIYNAASIILAMIFKIVTSNYKFKFPLTILMIQQLGILAVSTLALKVRDEIKGVDSSVVKRLVQGLKNIRIIYLLSIFYIVN